MTPTRTIRAKINKNYAFTLAEVLITLGIIGVIAVMTIPTLLNDTDNKALTTAFFENYSILRQASLSIINDNGGDIAGVFTRDQMADAFKEKLSVIKDCPDGAADGDCWASAVSNLNGDISDLSTAGTALWNNYNRRTLVLKNGATVKILSGYYVQACGAGGQTYTLNGNKGVCAIINLDVNGTKGPNKVGRDVYELYFTNLSGIIASGSYGTGSYNNWANRCNAAFGDSYQGTGCGGRLLIEGKMNY